MGEGYGGRVLEPAGDRPCGDQVPRRPCDTDLLLARGEVDERGVPTPTQAFGVDRLAKMLSDLDLTVEGPEIRG